MKKLIVILLVTCRVALAGNADSDRFQIVTGLAETIISTAKVGSSEKSPVIIKIDTQSGATWLLVRVLANGQYREGWVELGDLPPAATTTRKP